MPNPLFLPELREMLAGHDENGLREFCIALHPARTAEYMEGLSAEESWEVLRHAEMEVRVEIFKYFDSDVQVEIIESQPHDEVAAMVAEAAPDDRVDLLSEVDETIVSEQILPRLPVDERRDFLRLSAYPEGTAGAIMTTDVATLAESLTVREALDELARSATEVETIYYIYVVDNDGHLRGLVSARQLVSAIRRPTQLLGEMMETDLLVAHVLEDQEDVANKVARLDLLAIPVVNDEHHMIGIITHDDVIDVVREEATEDAHRIAAVDPLGEGYLKTHLLTMSWKRGMWLTILFFGAMLTAWALRRHEAHLDTWTWLVLFIPLIISSGGNTGSQSATLIITALSTGDIRLADWLRVIWRELAMGVLLGGFLAILSFGVAVAFAPNLLSACVLPATLVLVVMAGTLAGSILPMIFARLGWDPAMMSNPFVAGIIDILGIEIYVQVAMLILPHATPAAGG